MSLLNAFVRPDRALVAVDTDTVLGGASHGERSKLLVLPHAQVVFAARGDLAHFQLTFGNMLQNEVGSYDEAISFLPHVLAWANAHYRQQGRRENYQLAIVGFSDSSQGIEGSWAIGDTAEDDFDLSPLAQRCAPWEAEMGVPELPSTMDATMRVASIQAQWLRLQGVAGGGRIVFAEVTRSSIATRVLRLAE